MGTVLAIIAAVSGWFTTGFTWFKWRQELKEKRREKTAKEKAEAELALIQRRSLADNLYFTISDVRFNHINFPSDNPTRQFAFHPGKHNILDFMRNEVHPETPSDEPIFLLVDNHGCDAVEILMHLDGERVRLAKGDINSGNEVLAIRYPYSKERHGREQTLNISFLSTNGVRDTHVYKTTHGFRTLKRIDPP